MAEPSPRPSAQALGKLRVFHTHRKRPKAVSLQGGGALVGASFGATPRLSAMLSGRAIMMAMGVIGDIGQLIIKLYELWRDSRASMTTSPQELFANFVQPSYGLIKQVHEDYIEMYLELVERAKRDHDLSQETIDWFTRARARRHFDRSELRLLQLPELPGHGWGNDVASAAANYLRAVHAYFAPHKGDDKTGTRGRETQEHLELLLVWNKLSQHDRLAQVAIESFESQVSRRRDHLFYPLELIENLITGMCGDLTAEALSKMRKRASAAADAYPALEPFAGQEGFRFLRVTPDLHWKALLREHCSAQRADLERAIKDVQEAYIQVRICADRQ